MLICGKNALEMAEKCIFQTHANEKRAVVKRLSFNQLLRIISDVQQAIISRYRMFISPRKRYLYCVNHCVSMENFLNDIFGGQTGDKRGTKFRI